MPVLERSHGLEAQRVAWAAAGLAEGFIGKAEFDFYVALADVMSETGLRWWAPRHDQMWRYAR
jgi:hypothetical protein